MEDFKDLDFKIDDTEDQVESKIIEMLGIGLSEIKTSLTAFVIDKAEELTHQFTNIVPYGDYDKILEDNDGMAAFLRNEASKPENWKLQWLEVTKATIPMLHFSFKNTAVDDGEGFTGNVFVGLNGKVKHAFALGDS